MNDVLNKLSRLWHKFNNNRHLRVGLPFILAMGVGPTLLQSFVEIQFLFGKTGNMDTLQEEILKRKGPQKSREELIRDSYKEMIESRRDLLEEWEPVRVNRPWEEQDDTFKHFVTMDDLRLKD